MTWALWFPPCRKLRLKLLRRLVEDHKFRSSKPRINRKIYIIYITIIPAIPQGNRMSQVLRESFEICSYNSLLEYYKFHVLSQFLHMYFPLPEILLCSQQGCWDWNEASKALAQIQILMEFQKNLQTNNILMRSFQKSKLMQKSVIKHIKILETG